MHHCLISAGCVFTFALTASAEPPEVSSLFPVGGQRGTEVRVKLSGKVDAAASQVWFDRPGLELVGADGKDVIKLKIASDAASGLTWLRIHNADGASTLKPFYIGGSREVLEVEPNDAVSKAQPAGELPVVVNGVLEKSGEVDTFQVALTKGQTLVATLAAKQAVGSPMDGVLQITDSQGFVLEHNDDRQGFDPQIVLTAPRDGNYFVRVFAFSATPNTTIQYAGDASYLYRLTLTAGPMLTHVMPTAIQTGRPANVRPGGWNLPSDLAEIAVLALPTGMQDIFHDGWESTAKVLVTPHPTVVESEPNPLTQPQAITVPVVACGIIGESKDFDAWKFTAKANQRVSLRLSAVSLGSALDAVVRVFDDAAGQKLAEVDDAVQDEADVVLEFTAPKDGDYAVSVTDRFAHGGPAYWYALSMAEPAPTAVLQSAADAFTVKAETPLEIPITIDRRLGYALPLKIAMEGLPEGVSAEAVVSEPQGDSSKAVKLIVNSTRAERWSGPIKIVGRAAGDSQPERVVQWKSPANERFVPHLWLTALPKP